MQWVIAGAAFLVTVILQAEVAVIFLLAGAVGIALYGTAFRGRTPPAAIAPMAAGKLLIFFLKAGSLTFGSGLVIVPFLEKGLVQQTGWLDKVQFRVAGAIALISPGRVFSTATFVGAIVAGFWGSLVATVGI